MYHTSLVVEGYGLNSGLEISLGRAKSKQLLHHTYMTAMLTFTKFGLIILLGRKINLQHKFIL